MRPGPRRPSSPESEIRMEELVKVCPGCGAEYVPQIERCADCGETLVLPGQPADIPTPPAAPAHAPAGELVCVRVADLPWAKRLGARLERAGIDHLVEAEETPGAKCCHGAGRFRVLVRSLDAEAAMGIDAEQLCRDVPDLEPVINSQSKPETCPACGDPAPEAAAECPSCGLALVLEVERCQACGEPLPPGVKQCPGCGRDTGQRCC